MNEPVVSCAQEATPSRMISGFRLTFKEETIIFLKNLIIDA